MEKSQNRHWRVGELAQISGVSVRTLHHYDAIGLLKPTLYSENGHRRYAEADLLRLLQIKALRRLNLPLDDIRSLLDRAGQRPAMLLRQHLERLRLHVEQEQRICGQLEFVIGRLEQKKRVAPEVFLKLLEEMNMLEKIEKYYSPEQLEELRLRREQAGEQRMQEVQREWAKLYEDVRAAMQAGTDPAAPEAQALAAKWRSLIEEFTGGNPEIERSLKTMYAQEPEMRQQFGPEPALMAYINQAMQQQK